MGDAFSNWVNRGYDQAREISRRIQAGETPFHHTAKEAQHVQKVQQQQAHVDSVEISSKGHIPKGRVDKGHLVFEGSNGHGAEKPHSGSDKSHGRSGSDRQHSGSEKQHGGSEKQHGGAEKSRAGAEKQHGGSEKQQPGAEKPQHAGAEKPQHVGAEKPQHAGVEKPAAIERAARPAQVSEPVPPRSRSFVEPIVAKANLSAQEFLKRVADAGGFDHAPQKPSFGAVEQGRTARPADSHVQGPRANDHHAPRAMEGKSQYVEPRNLPEHVKQAQKDAAKDTSKGTHKEPTATPEGEKVVSKKPEPPKGPQIQEGPKAQGKNPNPSHADSNHSNMDLRTWAGKTVGTGLGFLGIAGGISETKQGIEQIRNGHKVEGALNVTAGASDITSGTASVLYTWGKTAMGSVAAKAGGVGSIFSGVSEGIQGVRTNDDEKKFEGGLKVVLGAGMMTAGRVSPLSASALAGWSGGRFIGSHVGWGGENIDTKVTRAADSVMNNQVNAELRQIEEKNQQMFAKTQQVIGKELERIEAAGMTRKDVTEAIIGMREEIEKNRAAGNSTEDLQKEIKRMAEIRGQLSR